MMNCSTVKPMLSDFIDNQLSARDTWEVDRHLPACSDCTRALNELRRTVALVADAPRREVSQEFMVGLQAKLVGLEPLPACRAWLASFAELFRPRVLPAWGAGLAAAALALILLLPRMPGLRQHPPVEQVAEQVVKTATRQNVAIQATDPLADIGSE